MQLPDDLVADAPAGDAALFAALAGDLAGAGFTVDGVGQVLGPMAQAAMHREQIVPARLALRGRREPVAVLARLLVLGEAVTAADLDAALPTVRAEGAARAGLVEAAGAAGGDEVRPLLDLRPYAADERHWWLASDLSELVTGGPLREDHVLGIGGASTTLARWTPRTPVQRVLDVGTGSGVQAMHAAVHAHDIVATDLSARCLAFARFNAGLNAAVPDGPFAGRSLDLRLGSLLDPVAGERFDLVVSNPPYVITPRVAGVPTYEYRDGGWTGDEVVRRLVTGMGDVLAPGGVAQLLGNWEHHRGEGWRDRVASWLPPDVDAWVVQRELQDPAEYAETWARDGGHRPHEPGHDALVEAWLRDFADRGVEAVGFGVLTLRRPHQGDRSAGGRAPLRRLEELTGPVGQGGAVGQVVVDVLAAEAWLAATSDADLLAAHLVVAPDVTEERYGTPGAADPQVVLLRQGGGLHRAVRADTALAGLVGACDGELAVGQVVGALGVLLDEPVEALRARLLPAVRGLVADGLLRPGFVGAGPAALPS
jgi:methylase of polypeptide subunit release factors